MEIGETVLQRGAWLGESFEQIYQNYVDNYKQLTNQEFPRDSFAWREFDVHRSIIAWAYWCEISCHIRPQVEFYDTEGGFYEIPILSLLQVTEYFDQALKRSAERQTIVHGKISVAIITHFPFNVIETCFNHALLGFPVPSELEFDVGNVSATYNIRIIEPLHQILDDGDDHFSIDSEDGHDDPPEYLLHNGRPYWRHKWYSKGKRCGWYYRCENRKLCNCKGSIFVSLQSEISTVSGHVPECYQITRENGPMFLEDVSFLLALRKHRMQHVSKTPCEVILDFLECHPEFSDNCQRYDVQSLVDLVGEEVPTIANATPYGKAANFVRMEMRLDSLHIIVVGNDEMLNCSQSVNWLMVDGTFKCVPKPFYQLVTVMGCLVETGKFVPIIHFLLPGKTQANYRAMFDILDTQTNFTCVNRITSDFEQGLQNEIELWMSRNQMEASFRGCRFHFAQALRKRMKKLYGSAINTDVKMKTLLRLITWFPLLTRDNVENIVIELQRRHTGIEKFLQYFVRFWIPKYDEWALNDDVRSTNNALEGYHSVLGEKMSKHPSISRFLMTLSMIDNERIRDSINPSRRSQNPVPVYQEIIYQFQEALKWFPMKTVPERRKGRKR